VNTPSVVTSLFHVLHTINLQHVLSLVIGHTKLTSARELTLFCYRGNCRQLITFVVKHNSEVALLWKCHTISAPEDGVGLVPKRGWLLMLAYYAFPRLYEFGERRRNDIDRGKPKNSEKNLSQCHSVHHKSHID
jgi:hypothetical protein